MSIFHKLDQASPCTAPYSLWFRYRMRWKRRRLLLRSLRKRRELSRLSVDEPAIRRSGLLCFSTVRNEMERLPHFLDHHRALGVPHFLMVDNASTDGTADFLQQQPDVSLWTTDGSYKASRFGVDWLTCLQFRFAPGKWALTLDADELLVLPGGADIPNMTAQLDRSGVESLGTVMLDLYPKGPLSEAPVMDHPLKTLSWFDADTYRARRHPVFDNLWIQGGPRDRLFFGSQPERSPTLGKTPLVKWQRGFAYVTSTHQILPRHLNRTYARGRPSGALLHTKFLPSIAARSAEEKRRREHFENSELYEAYYDALIASPDLWYDGSVSYEGAEQLERLGLISRGE